MMSTFLQMLESVWRDLAKLIIYIHTGSRMMNFECIISGCVMILLHTKYIPGCHGLLVCLNIRS